MLLAQAMLDVPSQYMVSIRSMPCWELAIVFIQVLESSENVAKELEQMAPRTSQDRGVRCMSLAGNACPCSRRALGLSLWSGFAGCPTSALQRSCMRRVRYIRKHTCSVNEIVSRNQNDKYNRVRKVKTNWRVQHQCQ